MADLKTPEDVHKYIASTIKPQLEDGLKVYATLKTSMPALIQQLQAALKSKMAERARLHARAMPQHLKRAEYALGRLDQASDLIDEVTSSDADFTAEQKALDAILAKLEEPKGTLAEWIRSANLLIKASQLLDKQSATDEKQALADWSHSISYLRQLADRHDEANTTAKNLAKDARDAVAKRDETALKTAQNDARKTRELLKQSVTDALKGQLEKQSSDHPDDQMSEAVKDQIERDGKEIAARAKKLEATDADTKKLLDEVDAATIEAPDARKAAKLLNLKPAQLPALEKALAASDSQRLKAFEAIAANAGSDLSAKDMIARLKREKIV